MSETTKLRTLKDLSFEINVKEVPDYPNQLTIDLKNDLKQEAIKHILSLCSEIPKKNCTNCNFDGDFCNRDTIEWILYFFNLSDEDIKNGGVG